MKSILRIGLEIVFAVLPIILMSELAIAEHSDLLPDEGDVRFARNIVDILTVTKSAGPKFFSEFYFYLGIF